MGSKSSNWRGALSSLLEPQIAETGSYAGVKPLYNLLDLPGATAPGGRYAGYAIYSPALTDINAELVDTEALGRNLVAGASAAALATAAIPAPAAAQCSVVGTDVNCTGTITGPVEYNGVTNYTLTVETGATVDSTTADPYSGYAPYDGNNSGVVVSGDTPTVINDGTVNAGAGSGVAGYGNSGVLAMDTAGGYATATNNGAIHFDLDAETNGGPDGGYGALAAVSRSSGGQALATNNGVLSAGQTSIAVLADGDATATATNDASGTINSVYVAVAAESYGTAEASNAGVINTDVRLGLRAEGFTATVSNSGNIYAGAGIKAFGVSYGTARAENLAGGRIESAYGAGIHAETMDGGSAIAFNAAAGIVVTGDSVAGGGEAGLLAVDRAFAGGITSAAAQNAGSVTTYGDRAYGVIARGYYADAYAVNEATGTVSTSGYYAHGLFAQTFDSGDVDGSNAGSIETSGDGAHGIFANARVYNSPNSATATNSGSIVTRGQQSFGLFVLGGDGGGAATATNSGSISNYGGYGGAVFVGAKGAGDSVAENSASGSILVSDSTGGFSNSFGIRARSAFGNAQASNAGQISVSTLRTGYSLDSRAYGIEASADGAGASSYATNSGSIIVSGDIATGIGARTQDGAATVENAYGGRIEVNGGLPNAVPSAAAMRVRAFDGGSAIAKNSGELISAYEGIQVEAAFGAGGGVATAINYSSGVVTAGARGINVSGEGVVLGENRGGSITAGSGIEVVAVGTGATATALNSGLIQARDVGLFGLGIEGADVLLSNSGQIESDYVGAFATTGSLASTGNVDFENSGTILSKDVGAFALISDGRLSIVNTGDIISGGIDTNASGAVFGLSAVIQTGATSFRNSGAVSLSTGASLKGFASRFGLFGDGAALDLENAASGVISNTSVSAYATLVNGVRVDGYGLSTVVNISNAGEIIATGDGASAIQVDLQDGDVNVDNTGVLNGSLKTQGVRTGSRDIVTNSGTITGDIDLGAFDDTLMISGFAPSLSGAIAGGDGFDTLIFDQTTSRVLASAFSVSISGFESIIAMAPETIIDHSLTLSSGETLSIAAGSIFNIVGADFIAEAGSTTSFGVASAKGQLLAGGDITFAGGSEIAVDVADLTVLMNGETFDAAIAGGALTDDSGAITDNSTLFDFSKTVLAGNTLQITIKQALMLQDIATEDANTTNIANALQELIDVGGAEAEIIATALGQFNDLDSLAAAINDFVLDQSNGAALAAIDGMDIVMGIIGSRLSGSTGGVAGLWDEFPTGLNAGDPLPEPGQTAFWAQGAGGWTNQEDIGFTTGFDAESFGFSAGMDHGLTENITIGAGYFYLSSDIEENGAGGAVTDLHTNGFLSYLMSQRGGLTARASFVYGASRLKSKRPIAVLGDFARSSFDADQIAIKGDIDYLLAFGSWLVRPNAALQYSRAKFNDYREEGSAAALAVEGRNVKSLRGTAGVSFARQTRLSGRYAVKPEFHVNAVNEFADVNEPVVGRFVAGNGSFATVVQDRDDFTLNIGGGLELLTSGSLSLGVFYDGEFGDGFRDHSVSATGKIYF